jgi:hypothetical protein
MKKINLIFLIPLLFILGYSGPTKAEQQGIKVSPAVVEMVLEKDSTEQVSSVGVKNNYPVKINLIAELKGVDTENGLLTPTNNLPEQLKNNLEIDKSNFSLESGQSINIRIKIKNTADLSPGGNYASLVIKQAGDKNNSIGLQPAVSVTIFIIKEEGAIKSVSVELIKINRFLWDMPSSASLRFLNTGNVGVTPRGTVTVNSNNTVNSRGVINQESVQVFPNNSITTVTELKRQSIFSFPGKKTLQVTYRFDGIDETQTLTKSFMYIPFWIFLVPIIFIAILIFILKRPKKTKPHKKPTKKVTKQPKTAKKITVKFDN